jgi:type VI secretion system secreted protein Hcp
MAEEILLQLDGITGESQDKQYPGSIEVMSYSFGASSSQRITIGSGAGAARASFQDLHFTTGVSKASPALIGHCATGEHIPKAVLHLRKTGETPFEFLTITLNNVIVTSFSESGAGAEVPVESVSLAYGSVLIEYKQQRSDGGIGTVTNFNWDLLRNRLI